MDPAFIRPHKGALLERGLITPETANLLDNFPTPVQLEALAMTESGGNPNARSEVGATGKFQIMPETRAMLMKQLGGDAKFIQAGPEQDKELARRYLQQLYGKFGKNEQLAFQAYHTGPGNVQKAIDATGSTDPELVRQYFEQNGMPRSAEYTNKIKEHGGLPDKSEAAAAPAPRAEKQVPQSGERIADAYEMQQKALLDQALAEEQTQTQIVEERTKQAQLSEVAAKMEQEKQAREEESVKKSFQIYQQAQEEALSSKVDPNHLWSDMSTGNKIAAAIGIALGGFAQGYSGKGSNTALEVITHAIDQDIEAQRANADIKGRNAQSKGQLYNQLLDQFQNRRQADAALRGIQLDASKAMIESFAAESKSNEAKANAQKLIGALEVDKQESLQKIEQEARNAPGYAGSQIEQYEAGQKELLDLPEDVRKLVVPGLGVARSTQDAADLSKAQDTKKTLDYLIGDMIQSRKDARFRLLDREAIATQQSNASKAILKMKNLETLGVLSGPDIQILEQIVPADPTDWNVGSFILGGQDPTLAKLESLRKYTSEMFKAGTQSRLLRMFPEEQDRQTDLGLKPR